MRRKKRKIFGGETAPFSAWVRDASMISALIIRALRPSVALSRAINRMKPIDTTQTSGIGEHRTAPLNLHSIAIHPLTRLRLFCRRVEERTLYNCDKILNLRTSKTTLNPLAMKKTALRSCSLAIGVALIGSFVTSANAQTTSTTDPVGFVNLPIQGASDNTMSIPMVRDAVFAGTVGGGITDNSFNVLAGSVSPAWTVSQFKYVLGTQPQTYYVEFTSGSLKGLFFKIDDNAAGSVTVDNEGVLLTADQAISGNPAGKLAAGDSFKIRPFWRVRDVFEVNGQPIIEPHPQIGQIRDLILIPNYTTVAINKAPNVSLYYLQGVGWQKSGDEGDDYGDFILRPNEAFVVRRNNAAPISLTSLGGVLMNKSVSFVPGGGAASGNDTFISISRPAAVNLDNSGLSAIMQPAAQIGAASDLLLAFGPGTGFNRTPAKVYFFLAGQPAGQGWRESGDEDNLTIGQTVSLDPGKVYVLRKKQGAPGVNWVNNANY
jgi:uncharacterized protein (TIGR02597 family)